MDHGVPCWHQLCCKYRDGLCPCDAGVGLFTFLSLLLRCGLTHSWQEQLCVMQVSAKPEGKTLRPGHFVLAVTSLYDVYPLLYPSLMLFLETSVSEILEIQPCWVRADATLRTGTCDLHSGGGETSFEGEIGRPVRVSYSESCLWSP